jgi:hypothetical protein
LPLEWPLAAVEETPMIALAKVPGLVAMLTLMLLAIPGPIEGQTVLDAGPPGGGWWYGDYLRGGADVIRAQAIFMVEQQKTLMLREKVRQERLRTKRETIEQWLWEMDNIPSMEDISERLKKNTLRHVLNDPPPTEIWTAQPLNVLMQHVHKTRSPGDALGSEEIPSDLLTKINVTNGKSSGNLGLIKDGKIWWPLLLRRDYFNEDRERLDDLVATAVQQIIKDKKPDVAVMSEMQARVNGLEKSLRETTPNWSQLPDWSPSLYIDAKHFVNQFSDAIRALQMPDAHQYLTGLRAPEGHDVASLMAYMKNNGLFFAPATPGSETAYTALYRKLRDYASVGPVLIANPPGK